MKAPKPMAICMIALFANCAENTNRPGINPETEPSSVQHDAAIYQLLVAKPDSNLSYQQTKAEINKIRLNIARQNLSSDSVSAIFTDLLLNRIIPYWYGTKWEFNGHTAIPGTGEIACGYFVSTTLSDMGIPVNRFKLAQQSPENEAKTLRLDLHVIEIQDTSNAAIIRQLKSNLKDGIYFIGLEQTHVGYLLKRYGTLFFLHSNYVMAQGVVIERAAESQVLSWFQHIYLAEISTNKTLMNRWLTGENMEVITE